MAALALRDGVTFDPIEFARFVDAQADLSPKWKPTYLRIARDLPRAATNKVQKRALQSQKFSHVGEDVIYWRPRGADAFSPFTAEDLRRLREQFARAGSLARLDA